MGQSTSDYLERIHRQSEAAQGRFTEDKPMQAKPKPGGSKPKPKPMPKPKGGGGKGC